MKAKLILVNWVFSFIGLMAANEYNPLWIALVGFGWFCVASLILIRADRKGVMDKLSKQLKIDEL